LSLSELVQRVKAFLSIDRLRIVGRPDQTLATLAVACGSAGEFLAAARTAGCDALLTGECRFHTCLDTESSGMALVLCGHYASERFAVEELAEVLAARFGQLRIWASRRERDPLRWC
jgi:putative NIF3 family GTP cyclohydrolase 1 type 2